jgi:hypothetical protein
MNETVTTTDMTVDEWTTTTKDAMTTRFRIAQQNNRREGMISPAKPWSQTLERAVQITTWRENCGKE